VCRTVSIVAANCGGGGLPDVWLKLSNTVRNRTGLHCTHIFTSDPNNLRHQMIWGLRFQPWLTSVSVQRTANNLLSRSSRFSKQRTSTRTWSVLRTLSRVFLATLTDSQDIHNEQHPTKVDIVLARYYIPLTRDDIEQNCSLIFGATGGCSSGLRSMGFWTKFQNIRSCTQSATERRCCYRKTRLMP
jgi:hypothetical protein